MHQLDAVAEPRQLLLRDLERSGIPVEPDQPGGAGLEQQRRMTGESNRAIDEHSAACRREVLEHLAHHHRFVRRR